MSKLVECVPNVSEGRDRAVIDGLSRAIASVAGVTLLDVDPGADTNRTVFTFVGPPAEVGEAAVRLAHAAAAHIDMRSHRGAHPRLGAVDVCPFVPVRDVTMDECVTLARDVGARIATELDVPVYFYERAASRPERESLAEIRAGEYEGLEAKLAQPAWAPDCGPAAFRPGFGASVVGARPFLVAYNVNLNTRDRRLANDIALSVRENGRLKRDAAGQVMRDAAGQELRVPGRLKAVRAIGWYIDEYRLAQVSVNLTDFQATPLHVLFETIVEEAAARGLRVTGSELVGLIPLEPLVAAGRHFLTRQGKSPGVSEREVVETAVRTLGLGEIRPFEVEKKVLEYLVAEPAPLAALTVSRFADEVSSESPAPGGGSVAALAGSLAAALTAMVANVTVGKKGYEAAWDELGSAAVRAQAIKDALGSAVDRDSAAFNAVLAAMRLPRGTPEQAAERDRLVAAANREAIDVPLDVVRRAVALLPLLEVVAERGNVNSLSDAGAAVHAARAAFEGAALSVVANLSSAEDEGYRRDTLALVDGLLAEGRAHADRLAAHVAGRLRG
jgi:glutamate formiminotransferase/formiminotetrahydrofolate cyclodeaminase